MIKKIFLDSSSLYSFIDRADQNHTQVVKMMDQFSLQGMQLYSSVQVVQEVYSAVNSQLGEAISLDFLQAILESDMEILYAQKTDLISAFRLLKLNRNKQISLKEALNATLMQRKNISQIVTYTYWHNLLGTTSYLVNY